MSKKISRHIIGGDEDIIMEEIKIDNIEKMLQSEPSEKLLIAAIKSLKVEKKDKKSRLILLLICFLISIIIGINDETVLIFRESVDSVLAVLLALFGIVFTGYSLLQAFMNKRMLLQLLKDTKVYGDGQEKTRLQDINENFVYLMLQQIIAILISLAIKIVLLCIADDFGLFTLIMINNAIAIVLITVYCSLVGIILWRTVSFVSSIFHLFNIYAVTRVLEILDGEDET